MMYKEYSVYKRENDNELVNFNIKNDNGKFQVWNKLEHDSWKDIELEEARNLVEALHISDEEKKNILSVVNQRDFGKLEDAKNKLLEKNPSKEILDEFNEIESKLFKDIDKLMDKF